MQIGYLSHLINTCEVWGVAGEAGQYQYAAVKDICNRVKKILVADLPFPDTSIQPSGSGPIVDNEDDKDIGQNVLSAMDIKRVLLIALDMEYNIAFSSLEVSEMGSQGGESLTFEEKVRHTIDGFKSSDKYI
jgi:hypothetical protein